ncbi:MAG: hypothetical protein M0Q92_08245 [Methanoregula sp.]|jgi:hypothetical protein|nr:hypothetical protein [Methanoregula sp.]
MKKKYLTWAGIVSAAILVIMFIYILATGSFTIFPTASIDTIPDHAAGDLVVITGTTNYPAGTRLSLDILTVSPSPGERARVGGTDAYIVRGGGMSNTWSGALDTSVIPPGEYRVNAYWVNETYSRSNLLTTSRIRLINATSDPVKYPPVSGNHTQSYIRIDNPGTIYRGEKILITGTTNLPEDTELLYLVVQQSDISVFAVDPKTGKQDMKGGFTRSGLIDVLPGENGVNRWSFAFDSTEAIPDRYEVIITLDTISTKDIGKVGPFGSESLVILEANSDRLTPLVTDTGPCQSISIDSLPGTLMNKTYTITGTTSLQPGTELLFTVLPAENEFRMNMGTKNLSGIFSGATGRVGVTRGTGDTNIWSADLSLATFPPKEYIMNVSNDRIDPRTYGTIYRDTYCSKRFTITG